jgi:aminoglycoside/choline kinase family phosphotransferase/dTDP-glucose pyrophosphorylase
MILAAGLGTRLRPLTEHVPKPLVPVLDRPLLENVVLNLRAAGVTRIAVNTHHLPEQVREFVATLPSAGEVELFHEPEILGTGGALVNAREFLSEGEYFLVHNGDVLADLDLSGLAAEHQQHAPLATMVLTPGHEDKVLVSAEGAVLDILGRVGAARQPGSRLLTYTGIAAVSRRIFEHLPPAGPSSLPAALIAALRDEPGCVRAITPEELYWNDVGTLERYLDANRDAIAGTVSLPGGAVGPGLALLVEQGSDRKFLRMPAGKSSCVLMFSPPEDPDNRRFVEIGRFLAELDLGAPRLLAVSADDSSAVLEDLGDERLYESARAEADPKKLEQLYSKVVSFLAELGARATERIAECPAANCRALDYEQLRWESGYFRENFLGRLLGFPAAETAALDEEFDRLARAVEAQPRIFMHRDFQSQNIIVKDGRVRIVDFQGARRGPLGYDLASLLRDAYVDLPGELRARLAEQYRGQLAELGGPDVSADLFREHLVLAGLQRSMQALGAFCFLSLVKGKESFRRFIAPGLERLSDGLAELRGMGCAPGPMPSLEEQLAAARQRLGDLDIR